MEKESHPNSDKTEGKTIQSADKIYNIGKIENANFGFVVGKKTFNVLLAKTLINEIRGYHPKIREFLKKIPEEFKDNWETEKTLLNQAKGLVEEGFVWIIGWQLRRLFAIGNKTASPEQTDDYLDQCLKTYKLALQVASYGLISHLWDTSKDKTKSTDTKFDGISLLFNSKISVRPGQYLRAFKELLNMYQEKKVPLPYKELENVNVFLDEEGEFMKACNGLSEIREIYNQSKQNPDHCFQAEEYLSTFLSAFRFLANYQLISLKKIEYEWQRNNEPRYLREFNILGKKENQSEHQRLLKYSSEPFNTYALFLRNKETKINLFPFIIDYNALTNEEGSKICLLEHRIEDSGLNYFFVDDESYQKIEYSGIMKEEKKDQIVKDEQQQKLKFDIVLSQFLEAQKTILGTDGSFSPVEVAGSDFDNL